MYLVWVLLLRVDDIDEEAILVVHDYQVCLVLWKVVDTPSLVTR